MEKSPASALPLCPALSEGNNCRSASFPTFNTLEKTTSALGVTPNELLSGEWKNISHMEQEILKFLECEERLNVELAHGQYDNYIG